MADFEIKTTKNIETVLQALGRQADAALEEIGLRAEGYAKMKTPVGTPESTGIVGYVSSGLRKSITHKVVRGNVFIGTNQKHAPYVELGTGIYATDGQGRKSPWVWRDKNGKYHRTRGMRPRHMMRDAIADHKEEYKKTVIKYLKGNA